MTNVLKTINGVLYKKSTSSEKSGTYCVGVGINNNKITLINTKSVGPVVEFTQQEWSAFLEGVKTGEFDINNLPVTKT